jgi:hypothetical protein
MSSQHQCESWPSERQSNAVAVRLALAMRLAGAFSLHRGASERMSDQLERGEKQSPKGLPGLTQFQVSTDVIDLIPIGTEITKRFTHS